MINDNLEFDGHEMIMFCHDESSGLRAIIAIHDSSAGPAMGGCRMAPYASQDAALTDVLRLSKGMSYKNIMAGLPHGGAKAVILADPATDKSPALLRAFARHVERLAGHFITGEDVGIGVPDALIMYEITPHVRGIPANGPGDPSPMTALGVFESMKVAVKHALDRDDIKDTSVHVQGVGAVGMHLSALLAEAGARLIVSDINEEACNAAKTKFGAEIISAAHWLDGDAEVYAPCALGATLNAQTIPLLRSTVVAGAANNQLACPEDGNRLYEKGILYTPDYVINAGGVISSALEGPNFDHAELLERVMAIPETVRSIFERARAEKMPTNVIADKIAQEKLRAARNKQH